MVVEQPLEGVTVLDSGQIFNGPCCGFLDAQAGERAIKSESPRGGYCGAGWQKPKSWRRHCRRAPPER